MENKEICSGVLQGQESCSFRMMAANHKYICRINKEGRKGEREEGGKEGGESLKFRNALWSQALSSTSINK